MALTKDAPEELKPFVFHGLDLDIKSKAKDLITTCPFCGREGKFSLERKTSKWRCFVCDEGGNQYQFIRLLWEAGKESAGEVDFSSLSQDRGLAGETLRTWGVVPSVITEEWLVPGFNAKGELIQLYRYARIKGGKRKLLATPNVGGHGLHGIDLYDPKKAVVYLCEGPWDAMRLWETLGSFRESKGKFIRVKESGNSLLKGANVLAVPGCGTFMSSWKDVFVKKRVYVVYDNDYPRKHPKTGEMQTPAGTAGVERVSGVLGKRAEQIQYLCWGPKGYDPKKPDGMDVRDILNGEGTLKDLMGRMSPVPEKWLEGEDEETPRLYPLECKTWLKLSNSWRRALRWGDGLDVSLSVMLACICSTELPGQDQLWVKIYGPASSGKSTLSEALSVARKYVKPKDTFTGLTSGYQLDKEGAENISLVTELGNMTLIINDGDTLLQMPNLAQVLSQLRAFYGRNLRTSYKNLMSTDHEGVNTTIIVCGTSSLRKLDQSELGERFLDCVIMEGIDDDHEDEVLLRVAERENRNLAGGSGDVDDPSLKLAKQLTGGYVEYLRENALLLHSQTTCPEDYLLFITRVAKFVAFMRARPSDKQKETAEREFGARLVSQHIRLAKCLAVVLNRRHVDKEVMRRTVKVAMCTARGVVFDICEYLYQNKDADIKELYVFLGQGEDTVRNLLQFLRHIGVTKQFRKKVRGSTPKYRWKLTDKLQTLFGEVVNWDHPS